jgi:hypothetical protein
MEQAAAINYIASDALTTSFQVDYKPDLLAVRRAG